jgi:hypothetical protein
MQRIHWVDLPDGLRNVIESRTGPVLAATTASEGRNSEVAAFLATRSGEVFIKGLRSDHPRVGTQDREAMVNPYVLQVAPRLLWHVSPTHGTRPARRRAPNPNRCFLHENYM